MNRIMNGTNTQTVTTSCMILSCATLKPDAAPSLFAGTAIEYSTSAMTRLLELEMPVPRERHEQIAPEEHRYGERHPRRLRNLASRHYRTSISAITVSANAARSGKHPAAYSSSAVGCAFTMNTFPPLCSV